MMMMMENSSSRQLVLTNSFRLTEKISQNFIVYCPKPVLKIEGAKNATIKLN